MTFTVHFLIFFRTWSFLGLGLFLVKWHLHGFFVFCFLLCFYHFFPRFGCYKFNEPNKTRNWSEWPMPQAVDRFVSEGGFVPRCLLQQKTPRGSHVKGATTWLTKPLHFMEKNATLFFGLKSTICAGRFNKSELVIPRSKYNVWGSKFWDHSSAAEVGNGPRCFFSDWMWFEWVITENDKWCAIRQYLSKQICFCFCLLAPFEVTKNITINLCNFDNTHITSYYINILHPYLVMCWSDPTLSGQIWTICLCGMLASKMSWSRIT